MTSFQVGPDSFLLDGRPFRVISGAMHYFRTLPEQQADRLGLLRAMGLNTIETYVAWNVHEPTPGKYLWNGLAGVEGFLDLVAEQGMYAIVRPGPYICAEWDNGGLPGWLLRDRSTGLRCYDADYLAAADRWFDQLIPRIAHRQVHRGGNVIMVQVENEYGSYGTDKAYLEHLAAGLRTRGIGVPLFTSDGPTDSALAAGTLPGVLATANFGSSPKESFAALRRHQLEGPLMCAEYWNGWFDHWGEPHHTRSADDAAATLDEILELGASVNIYMAHGGTNFGFWAGANRAKDELEPTVTSYDYDAPLDEAGRPTPKYWAFRDVIARHTEPAHTQPAVDDRILPPGELSADGYLPVPTALDLMARQPKHASRPLTFEDLGLGGGLVRYRASVAGPRETLPLAFDGLADIAHVWIDDRFAGVMSGSETLPLEVPQEGVRLEIVVSAYGRTNFGHHLGDHKGISGGVRHGEAYLHGWECTPVALDALPVLEFQAPPQQVDDAGPGLWRATLHVDELGQGSDGFLGLPGWETGFVWVNGFCLGRYDVASGPQQTLYLPWPLLRPGANEVAVLELGEPGPSFTPTLALRAEPDLGPTS